MALLQLENLRRANNPRLPAFITELYHVEDDIRGEPADARRAARQERSRPILAKLEPWLLEKLGLISQKTKLAEAIRYMLSRWEGAHALHRRRTYRDRQQCGRALNSSDRPQRQECSLCRIGWRRRALGRRRFVHRTCKLNHVEPLGYLADVLARIVEGHPNSQINDLLPWAYVAAPELEAVA